MLKHYQPHSPFAQNDEIVGSQSQSRTENPKRRQPTRIEFHNAEKHPRAVWDETKFISVYQW